jgi:hypothetical protein
MTNPISFDSSLIAPCGINCGTCMAYLRTKEKCPGCRIDFGEKRKTCKECKIKNCDLLSKTSSKFCYECESFPCDKIIHIDRRYKKKYHARLIDNLLTIREYGINQFLGNEVKKWTCPQCGSVLCVHRDYCLVCSYENKCWG